MKNPKTVKDFYKNQYSEKQIRNFIKKYPEKINKDFWWDISKYQVLSEDFIRDFKYKVYWWIISEFQDLSESFIREFKDKVYWKIISEFQDLSETFLIEFIKDIEIGDEDSWGLIDNKKIPKEVKNRIIDLKNQIEKG